MLLEEFFWDNVAIGPQNACWPWTKHLNRQGYGKVFFGGTHYVASRVAYALTFGKIALRAPRDNSIRELVLHNCDNPSCCNPRHLFLGNNSDNMLDMHKKKRHPSVEGANNGRAKLSAADARLAKQWYRAGLGVQAIATHFGVSYSSARCAALGLSFKNAA